MKTKRACLPLLISIIWILSSRVLPAAEPVSVAAPGADAVSSALGGLASSAVATPSPESGELARLEALPPSSVPLDEARLSSAISLVATAAGMSFVAPAPEDFPESVSISSKINPWKLLQLLADRYRFRMNYRDGVWLFDREPVGALVSRTYVLRHTNLDTHKGSQNSFKVISDAAASDSIDVAQSSTAGGLVYSAQSTKLVEDLRSLLGLPPSNVSRLGEAVPVEARRPVKGEAAEQGSADSRNRGNVLYLADTNSLYVTATLRQHEHVQEYLRIVDHRVPQIRIEARFFETSHDPKKVLGMDPSGFQPGMTLSNINTNVDLGRVRATVPPDNALLSMDNLRFQLQALNTDDRTKLVNNPTVVVANNREAYFSVGDEEPFVSSNTYNSGAADAGLGTSQARIAIRRIGTSVNLIPSLFEGNPGEAPRIRLVVRVEVGVLKGFRHLNSVDVPVVSSQKYEYTVYLRAGETLAFGGLSGVSESESVRKVPVIGDIPVLGYLFKSHSKQASQRNLVAYLTASIVPDDEKTPMPPLASK